MKIAKRLLAYVNEPCRVCGKMIEPSDLDDLVYAGYSVCNKSRSAHGDCWVAKKPMHEWAFPHTIERLS